MNGRSWVLKVLAAVATSSALALASSVANAASASHKSAAGTVSAMDLHTASSAYCGGAAYAPPGWQGYGVPSQTSDAIIGSPGLAITYSWTVQGNFGTAVAVQALGFDSNGNGTWYNIGVSFEGGSGVVPWGNVLAYPELRAESGTGNGVFVTWNC